MTKILAITPVWRQLDFVVAAQQAMLDASPVTVDWWRCSEQTYRTPDNRNISVMYQAAVMRARAGDYTHLLTLEDDIVPPSDAISKLLDCDTEIAYSIYCWRRSGHHWSAYRYLFEDSGASWSDDEAHTAAAMAQHGEIKDVAGVGNGCTLIDLRVFNKIMWRCSKKDRAAQDWWLALDAQRTGIQQKAHFGLHCGHTDPRWGIIWPDPNGIGKQLYRYEPIPEQVPA